MRKKWRKNNKGKVTSITVYTTNADANIFNPKTNLVSTQATSLFGNDTSGYISEEQIQIISG